MKKKAILSLEKDNTSCIYLIKEGAFWRAYNCSAFLLSQYVRSFKVSKKHYKIIQQEMVYVGFPSSILEVVLKQSQKHFNCVSQEEGLIKLELQSDEAQPTMQEYQAWRNGISTKPQQEKLCTEIFKRITTFPIMEKTPIESQLFLVHLQQSIHGTL